MDVQLPTRAILVTIAPSPRRAVALGRPTQFGKGLLLEGGVVPGGLQSCADKVEVSVEVVGDLNG